MLYTETRDGAHLSRSRAHLSGLTSTSPCIRSACCTHKASHDIRATRSWLKGSAAKSQRRSPSQYLRCPPAGTERRAITDGKYECERRIWRHVRRQFGLLFVR